jgi:RNA polymerase sigma factor (sigma-70 family)
MRPELSSHFQALFLREFEPLCKLAYNLTSDYQGSRNIVQKVFLALWNEGGEIIIDESTSTRLKKETIQACYQVLKDQKRNSESVSEIGFYATYFSGQADQVVTEERLEGAIRKAVDSLPAECMLIFLLSRRETMPYQEIALMLDLSEAVVERQVGTAIETLRNSCEPFRKER